MAFIYLTRDACWPEPANLHLAKELILRPNGRDSAQLNPVQPISFSSSSRLISAWTRWLSTVISNIPNRSHSIHIVIPVFVPLAVNRPCGLPARRLV